ncbi:phage tail protein [Citrobacter sp. Cb027]|uniref:phage tail protein n=1 Tax=Citrobacter sp. Cb027 TaxID=2985023 RepID=UPI00257E47DA|nr:phage tail protein [Citrobacter sp. Cb027]MDM3447996.1 phage tail protein [Citrobacter sp. Cb027]
MYIRGMENAIENLNRLNSRSVPGAVAMALNRLASSVTAQSASQVAREVKIHRKFVRERMKIKKATPKKQSVRIQVNRGDFPVIKLGNARLRLSRRKRRRKGERSAAKGGGSVLVVGNRRIPSAFIQRLKNGRWHVMQRVEGKNRYPIDVVKIPMEAPLTSRVQENIARMHRDKLPAELSAALKQKLRTELKKR